MQTWPRIRPEAWDFAPELTEHPNLWRDCAFCIIYVQGRVMDLVRRVSIADANLAQTITQFGEGGDHSGRVQPGYSPLNPADGGFTLLTYANPASSGQVSLLCQRVGNLNNHMELRANAVAGRIRFVNNGSNVDSVASMTDGTFHVFAGRRAQNAPETINLPITVWRDGVDVTDGVVTNSISFSNSGTFVLGGLPGTTTIHYTGDKLIDVGWNRGLTDAEMRIVGLDPFAMLRMREEEPAFAFFPAASGPAPGFQPAWARGSTVTIQPGIAA